ncbi:MAG: hypothetical protein KDD38_09915 [Bdellovibrionales bacterium]|nr:hypothetical protein [Bdellovibrionales bacterium]
MRFMLFAFIFMFGFASHAQHMHERMRRVTVFPLQVSADLNDIAETVWWDLRERLTDSKRVLVASKNFMQAKDVFQPRGELQPADALILGRLLDANALITTFLKDRKLSMRVYETKSGFLLWGGDINLHPAVQVSKQLQDAAHKLLLDFISAIPYQGFVSVDSLIGKPSYKQGDTVYFKADVGTGTQITVGDTVQLIRIKPDKYKPLFQGGANIVVYAEGYVVKIDRQIITAQLVRKQEGEEIQSEALVRIPDELRRIKEIYGMHESADKNIGIESILGDSERLTQKEKEYKPLVTSLSWIGNFALILLLAF